MATEKRLIDIDKIKPMDFPSTEMDGLDVVRYLNTLPTVDAVELPCKIGDFVWAIRSFHGHKHPQRGIVSDMYFLEDMSLQIIVKYVARGKWGETVFSTDKEAYAAIEERKMNNA